MNRAFTAVVLAGILMVSVGVLPQAFASTFEAWEFKSLGEVLVMSAMQDMSGDRIGEFVAAAEKSTYLVNGATGKEIWNHTTSNSFRWITITSLPSFDVNKDGKPDVLAATKDRFIIILDGANGNQIWNFTASASSYKLGELCYATTRSAFLASDIDKDGIPDIVIVSGSGDQCPKDDWFSILAISAKSGQKIWEYTHAEAYHGLKDGIKGSSPAALLDMDKDGTEDVVVIDDHSMLYVINGLTGSAIRTQELHVFGVIWNLMIVPDISGDGVQEAIIFEFIDGGGGPDYASIDAVDLGSAKVIWQVKAGDGLYNGGALYAGAWIASGTSHATNVAVIQRIENELDLLLLDEKTGQEVMRFHLGEDKGRDDLNKYYPLQTMPDLDGNGYDELIVGSIDSTIRLMDGNSLSVIWSHSLAAGNNFISSIPVGVKQRYILIADKESSVVALGALTSIETKLTLESSEETVMLSHKVVVSGTISPPLPGEIVELRYTDPIGFISTKPLVIARDGSYSDTINPKVIGSWKVKASYAAEGYYTSSASPTIVFTVENETDDSFYNIEVKSEDNTSTSYPVGYSIDGGQVDRMSIDKQKKSLDINITPTEKGELRLELSRSMIDAGNSSFQVYVDGKAAKFAELEKNSEMRVISIPFSADSKQIRIIGTHIVPEFPLVQISLILALILVILAIAMQSNRIHLRRW